MLRAGDIRLKDRAQNLHIAARNAGVRERLMDAILWAEEIVAFKYLEYPREERPLWPKKYSKEQLEIIPGGINIKELIMEKLLKQEGEKYILTPKALEILEDAAKIRI